MNSIKLCITGNNAVPVSCSILTEMNIPSSIPAVTQLTTKLFIETSSHYTRIHDDEYLRVVMISMPLMIDICISMVLS